MIIVENALPEGYFDAVRNTAINTIYEPVDRSDEHNTSIFVAGLTRMLEAPLNKAIEGQLGEFETITSYLRLNSSEVDTSLRVHSDGLILGQQPTHGVIFGIQTPEDSGTGFWNHKEHGHKLPDGVVQDEADYSNPDLWEFSHYEPVTPNKLIAYPSNHFHQRYPTVQSEERVVWVSFIRVTTA